MAAATQVAGSAKKSGSRWEFLQGLGKTFMLPVALLAFCGIVLGLVPRSAVQRFNDSCRSSPGDRCRSCGTG